MANCIFTSRLGLLVVLPACLCSVQLKESKYDAVKEIVVDLSKYVMENYMTDGQGCVAIISETTREYDIQIYNSTSLIRIMFDNSATGDCDENMKFKLAPCFESCCTNYVIQISKPTCFITAWNEANYEFPALKQTPRLLFLPFPPFTVSYAEDLYADNGTDVLPDILVAEYDENGTDGYVNFYTNNFNEHPSQPGRKGSILLDKWIPGRGLEGGADLYPDKILDLKGKEMKAYVVDYPPYTMNVPLDGIEVQIIIQFCQLYNCSVVNLQDKNYWGDIDHENGVFNGCSGLVYLGIVDFCIGANYAWIRHWPHVDFSNGYYSGALFTIWMLLVVAIIIVVAILINKTNFGGGEELTVIVPKPAAVGGWSTPFLPFSAVLWVSLFFCTIVSTAGLHGITIATFRYVPSFRAQLVENNKFLTLTDSFIRSIGMVVLQQPQQLVPGSPVRHLFTALEIVYLVFTTCYAAELYDYLTVPRTEKPIENIHDLAVADVIWMGNADAYTLMIRNSEDPKILKAVDNYKILPDEEIIALGESGGYGMVTERVIGGHFVELPFITEKFIELSITMKEAFVQSQLYVFLKKGSAYTKRLNILLGRLSNSGLMYKWEDSCSAKLLDYSKQQKLYVSTREVKYPPKVLKVSDIEGAFVIYFIGIILSIVLFITELYHSSRKSLRQPRK